MKRILTVLTISSLGLLAQDLAAQSSRLTEAVNQIGSQPLVVNAPEGPSPVMEEKEEMSRLRNLAPVRIPVQQATLATAINVIASTAGMNFVAPPADQFPELVTISVQVNPYRLLEILSQQYRFSMTFDRGVWKFSREPVGALVARTFKLKHTNLDTFTARQISFSGSSDSGSDSNSSSGDSGSSSSSGESGGGSGEGGSQVFKVDTQKIVDDIRELIGLPSTSTRALIAKDGEILPGEEGKMPVLVLKDNQNGARVIPLPNTNSIYVVATRQQIEYVAAYIAELDQPESQIRIVARFIATKHEPSSILGVDWENAQPGVELTNLNNKFDFNGDPSSSFRRNALLSVSDLNWQLNFLEKDSNSRLVNNGTVVTANNREVHLSVGTEEPFIDTETSQSGVEGAFGASRTKVKFRRIGTSMNIIPTKFEADGQTIIRLFVVVEVSSLQGFRQIGTTPVPIVQSQRYLYTVFVPEGYTLAFGGLTGLEDSNDVKSVSGLGKIPGIGGLFRSTSKTKKQLNLLAYITPSLYRGDDFLVPLSRGDVNTDSPAVFKGKDGSIQGKQTSAAPKPEVPAVPTVTAAEGPRDDSSWRAANGK